MKLTRLEDLEDRLIGEIGTPVRDKYENEIEEEIQAYNIGAAILTGHKA